MLGCRIDAASSICFAPGDGAQVDDMSSILCFEIWATNENRGPRYEISDLPLINSWVIEMRPRTK